MCRLLVLAALVFALPARAVTIDWVPVGNPNNTADTPTNCFAANCGSVDHAYYISKYETTNTQYADFLNAKAASDPLGLYNTNMGNNATFGDITQSGVSGSCTYSVKAGFENKPVTYVSFYDSLRFSNWLNNGQGSADTETGAYTITVDGITTENTITRNGGANIFLPSENEWYEAAYCSPGGVYFDYPTGTDSETGCVVPGSDTENSANCAHAVDAAPSSPSPTAAGDGGPACPWTKTSLRRVWKSACDASGVEIGLYEGTKYSRATDLLRQGVSERVLQALLGHRDARSTRRYARLADEALVAAIRPRRGSSVDPVSERHKK
jgi:formylglycine-generating enzyme required for sulfatase activity